MAGRPMNKLHQEDVRKHYVYELFSDSGVEYVGKGSGRRLQVQMRRHGLNGRVVKWFASEKAAYAFEIVHIAATSPARNKCAGGNGMRTKARKHRKCAMERLCDRLGTRVVAARLALNFPHLLTNESRAALRAVAYA